MSLEEGKTGTTLRNELYILVREDKVFKETT